MKVLIVDDSDLLQNRLKKALTEVNKSLSIELAGTCREARELFPPFGPDIVILDIALPDGSGIDLLQSFKKDDPDVIVIMFTNYPTTEFKKSCIELGANQFLDKSSILKLLNNFR